MKNKLKPLAYLCLLGILIAGILFSTGTITGPILNLVAIICTVGWFTLRLWPTGKPKDN
jgi:hypothetical protein